MSMYLVVCLFNVRKQSPILENPAATPGYDTDFIDKSTLILPKQCYIFI